MEKHRAWLRGKDVLKKHKVMRMVRVDWINHFEKYRPNLEQCLADCMEVFPKYGGQQWDH